MKSRVFLILCFIMIGGTSTTDKTYNITQGELLSPWTVEISNNIDSLGTLYKQTNSILDEKLKKHEH